MTSESNIKPFFFKAKRYFQQGSEYEKSGRLYEAIQYYKKAEQLVPDIDFRFYESLKTNIKKKNSEHVRGEMKKWLRKNNINVI